MSGEQTFVCYPNKLGVPGDVNHKDGAGNHRNGVYNNRTFFTSALSTQQSSSVSSTHFPTITFTNTVNVIAITSPLISA